MIGICVGILLVGLMPVSISFWLIGLFVLCCGVLLLYRADARGWRSRCLIQFQGFLFGVVFAGCWGHWQMAHRLPVHSGPVDLVVIGEIISLPQVYSDLQRFDFRLIDIHSEGPVDDTVARLSRVRLNWYRHSVPLVPGDIWQVRVRLKPVQGMSNPGAQDYQARLFSEGIGAVGYVRDVEHSERLGQSSGLSTLRYEFRQWLEAQPLSVDTRATLKALLLGDKTGLQTQHWQLLRDTGTVHLVVISGLHVGLVCLIGYLVGALLQWGLLLIGVRASADIRAVRVLPALMLAALYAGLAGFSVPTQRALVMAVALLVPPLFNLHMTLWQRFILALVVVLLLQPLSFLQPGFWLSFGAVAVLISGFAVKERQQGVVLPLVAAQWMVFLGLFPLLLIWLGSVAPSGPLVNMLAVPFVSFILLPGAVLGCLLLPFNSVVAGTILDSVVALFWSVLSTAVEWLPAELALVEPPLWSALLAYLGVILLLQSRAVFFRWIGVFMFVPLIFPVRDIPQYGSFRATVIDVGQGLSVLVETRDFSLLYDTGRAFRSGGSVAGFSVLPVLRHQGIRRLDRLVISHGDNDHAGGYHEVAAATDVLMLESGSERWREQNAASVCQSGELWRWNGVEFRYIHPAYLRQPDENNRSCVLYIRTPQCSLLIPGDIETDVEHLILRQQPGLQIDWLVASHHGSNTSTSERWLASLDPGLVIFSAGLNNRYGHPAADVVERVAAQGVRWVNTANAGAVILESSADGCIERHHRREKKRYWSAG